MGKKGEMNARERRNEFERKETNRCERKEKWMRRKEKLMRKKEEMDGKERRNECERKEK